MKTAFYIGGRYGSVLQVADEAGEIIVNLDSASYGAREQLEDEISRCLSDWHDEIQWVEDPISGHVGAKEMAEKVGYSGTGPPTGRPSLRRIARSKVEG